MYVMFAYHSHPITTIRTLEKHTGEMIWFYLFLIVGERRKKLQIKRLKGQHQLQYRSYLDSAKNKLQIHHLCETKF